MTKYNVNKEFNFTNFAKSITGKRVKILNKKNDAFQTLSTIVVGNYLPNYHILHEVCHYIVSTSENKNKYNLIFGKENNNGYNKQETEDVELWYKDERLTDELQKYFIEDNLKNNITETIYKKSIWCIRWIIN